MKKIFFGIFLSLILFTNKVSAFNREDILPNFPSIFKFTGKCSGTGMIDCVIKTLISWMFIFLPVCAIGAIVYAGYLLITGYGDETKFKHAWHVLVYTFIGIALVVFAYMIVKIVRDISL